MKLSDNKYLLYRHRWIYPYVKILLGTIRFLAIVASLLLIVAFIYEHGFVISYADVETLSKVYHGVWIVFLVDIISHLLLSSLKHFYILHHIGIKLNRKNVKVLKTVHVDHLLFTDGFGLFPDRIYT